MYAYKGKTALVTGASSGIGEAFAYQLAEKGMNLVLVARSEDKLIKLAQEISQRHAVKVEVIPADLSRPGTAQTLYDATQRRNLPIDLLVNNAGFSTYGNFEDISPEKDQEQVQVNVASVVDLSHIFIPAMLKRGGGAVINVASTMSFVPLPRQAVYAASKAFVLSFSEALRAEYRQRGIRVMALCPGAVATGFFDVLGAEFDVKADTPQRVVQVALRAFEQNRQYVIPGGMNYLQFGFMPRLLPRRAMLSIIDRVTKQIVKSRPQKTSQSTALTK